MHWDNSLPPELLKIWETCMINPASIKSLQLPQATCFDQEDYEVHVLCEVSPKAYGAVVHLVTPSHQAHIFNQESRVATVKE